MQSDYCSQGMRALHSRLFLAILRNTSRVPCFQDIRTSREGCALLAEKAGRLALSVLHEAIQVEASPMTSHMTARLERFYEHVSSHLVHYSQDNNLFLVQDAERDIRIYDKQTLPPKQVVRERFGK